MRWLSTLGAKACGTSSRLKTAPASCTVSQMVLMRWVSETLLLRGGAFFSSSWYQLVLKLCISSFQQWGHCQWGHCHSTYQFTKKLIMTYTHSFNRCSVKIRHQPFVAFKKLVIKKSPQGQVQHLTCTSGWWGWRKVDGRWEVPEKIKWHWSRKWQEGAVLTFPFPCVYHRFRSQLSTYYPSTFHGRQKKLHPKPPPPQQVVVILLCICFIMVWSCVIALGLTKTTVALFSSDLFMKSKDGLQMHEGVFFLLLFFFLPKYIDLFPSFSKRFLLLLITFI